MSKNEALKIIEDNINGNNDSLLDFMHERYLFDEQAFWAYYQAVRRLGFATYKESLPRDLTAKIIRIYEHFLLLITCHFNKNDMYEIENLPANYNEYYDRIRIVVNAYLLESPISEKTEGNLNRNLENQCDKKQTHNKDDK